MSFIWIYCVSVRIDESIPSCTICCAIIHAAYIHMILQQSSGKKLKISSSGLFTRDEFPFYRIGTRRFLGNGTAINATQSATTRTVKIITNLYTHASPPHVFPARESVNTVDAYLFSLWMMGLAYAIYSIRVFFKIFHSPWSNNLCKRGVIVSTRMLTDYNLFENNCNAQAEKYKWKY